MADQVYTPAEISLSSEPQQLARVVNGGCEISDDDGEGNQQRMLRSSPLTRAPAELVVGDRPDSAEACGVSLESCHLNDADLSNDAMELIEDSAEVLL